LNQKCLADEKGEFIKPGIQDARNEETAVNGPGLTDRGGLLAPLEQG
jgi:hypothetical protein